MLSNLLEAEKGRDQKGSRVKSMNMKKNKMFISLTNKSLLEKTSLWPKKMYMHMLYYHIF
jgi:hypothetical protein